MGVQSIGAQGSEIRGGFTGGWFRLVVTALIFARGGVNPLGCFRLVFQKFSRASRAKIGTKKFFCTSRENLGGIDQTF